MYRFAFSTTRISCRRSLHPIRTVIGAAVRIHCAYAKPTAWPSQEERASPLSVYGHGQHARLPGLAWRTQLRVAGIRGYIPQDRFEGCRRQGRQLRVALCA